MPNIMELSPPMRSVIFRDIYWPMAMKMTMGSTQLRTLIRREVCWISSPVVETPASSRRWTRLSSGTMAVL